MCEEPYNVRNKEEHSTHRFFGTVLKPFGLSFTWSSVSRNTWKKNLLLTIFLSGTGASVRFKRIALVQGNNGSLVCI